MVIPELGGGVFLAEPVPQRRTDGAEVGEDGAGVVQLVARGNEQRIGVLLGGKVCQVGGLTIAPCRFGLPGNADGVGAAEHDVGDVVAEVPADSGFGGGPVGRVLDAVVQQPADRSVLASAVFQDERGDGQEVG